MQDITTRNVTSRGTVDDKPIVTTEKEAAPKEPGRWEKIFDRIVGTASVIFPNPGSLLGNLVRRSGDTQQIAQFQRAMDQSIQHSWNMLTVQKQVQDQSLEVSLVSNLLKSRHDGHMAAVQNIKS